MAPRHRGRGGSVATGALASLAAALLLAACGGSVDSGAGGGVAADPERLDQTNALDAAELVVGRSLDATALVDLVALALVAPVVDPDLAVQLVPQQLLDCDNPPDGTVALSINDRDSSGFVSDGDTASLQYSACLDSRLGRSLNGAADTTSIGVTDLEEPRDPVPPPPWSVEVDLELTGVNLTGSRGTALLAGTVRTTHTTEQGEVFDRRVEATQLDFDDAVGEETLRALQVERVDDRRIGEETFTLTLSGSLASTRLGGSVDFATSPPLQGPIGSPPTAGTLTVTGEGGTRLVITAEPSRNGGVRLTLDDEGDGIDAQDQAESIATTWGALGF